MPKIVDRAVMREGILDGAMDAFASRGFHAATIADDFDTALSSR